MWYTLTVMGIGNGLWAIRIWRTYDTRYSEHTKVVMFRAHRLMIQLWRLP